VKAVDGVSLSIDEGELVGFLGPNGAGKSTTIKMMIGALMPSGGDIRINNYVPFKNRRQYVRQIGVVIGQRSQLWWDIPVIESFKVLKEIYEISDGQYHETMDLYRSLLDIEHILKMPVRNLSLGQRTLSDILAAFLHKPKIIFLDEPTIGLDVSIKASGQGVFAVSALIYSSNQLNLHWTAGSIALLILLVLSSSLVVAGIILLASVIGFWTLNPNFALIFIFRIKDRSHIPLNVYNDLIKFLFTFILPIGYVAYYPVKMLLRPDEIDFLVYLSPVMGLLVFTLAYFVWVRAASYYAGTGS
jgi:ABC-type Na+ transport system ATPase subunit NatA